MALCGSGNLSIPIVVGSSSTLPALGRFRQHRFPSLRSSSTTGILRVSSRSTSLLSCQDGRRSRQGSNEDSASAGGEAEEEKTDAELDMSTLEKALARSFGTALWYTVLIVSLAVFAGGYIFLLVKYGDFGDVPILSGSQK